MRLRNRSHKALRWRLCRNAQKSFFGSMSSFQSPATRIRWTASNESLPLPNMIVSLAVVLVVGDHALEAVLDQRQFNHPAQPSHRPLCTAASPTRTSAEPTKKQGSSASWRTATPSMTPKSGLKKSSTPRRATR